MKVLLQDCGVEDYLLLGREGVEFSTEAVQVSVYDRSAPAFCSFENDPSPLPKIVQKQVRQGNMTAITQVRNPERIEITCKKDCPCYDPEFECLRQFGTCGKCENI